MIHISIIGTGYIAQRFIKLLPKYVDVELDYVLTRRPIDEVWGKISNVTREPEAIKESNVIVDFSGDAKYLYSIIKNHYSEGKIVTFNSEFHVTYPYINNDYPKLLITEGEGDQPGSFAKLAERAEQLGFKPMVFINNKRFLDYNPSPESMKKWAESTGLSEKITVASTDGTKVSFETAFIANAMFLEIPTNGKRSYYYSEDPPTEETDRLAYVKFSKSKGISVIAKATKKACIADLKYLGFPIDQGWATFSIPYHLCQYDIINTIRDLYYRDHILLAPDPGSMQRYNVYAISKTWLFPGDIIKTGIGGYDVRGEIREINYDSSDRQLLPVIDCENVRVKEEITPGMLIYKDMVEEI